LNTEDHSYWEEQYHGTAPAKSIVPLQLLHCISLSTVAVRPGREVHR